MSTSVRIILQVCITNLVVLLDLGLVKTYLSLSQSWKHYLFVLLFSEIILYTQYNKTFLIIYKVSLILHFEKI